jgi:hypothetical protein
MSTDPSTAQSSSAQSSSAQPSSAHPTPASLRPVIRPAISEAAQWGRVAEDGTVYLKAPEGEVVVVSTPWGPRSKDSLFMLENMTTWLWNWIFWNRD